MAVEFTPCNTGIGSRIPAAAKYTTESVFRDVSAQTMLKHISMRLPSGRTRLSSLSRCGFLRGLSGSVGLYALSRNAIGQVPSPLPVFEEIPNSLSGIRWTHCAARSSQKYLPESTGPGCAFLDYDNDGWMDIYLVNSGKSDFYTPTKPL